MSLTELCQELKNWFEPNYGTGRLIGEIKCEGGAATFHGQELPLMDGQYFRVVGSVFNDGVHRYPHSFKDETFDGAIWAMAIPPEVIALSEDIDAWIAKYGGADSAAMSPFQSESFGGYSYSKGFTSRTGNGDSGGGNSWQSVFADRLKLWRKV